MTTASSPKTCYSCDQPVPAGEGFDLPTLYLLRASTDHKKERLTSKWNARPALGDVHVHVDCIDDPSELDWPANKPFHAWAMARITQMQHQIDRMKSILRSPA